MKQKQWLIPLFVLFFGLFLPITGHAAELKETDKSVVKWDTAKIEKEQTSENKLYANYTFEKESYDSYDAAVEGIARYAVDLVGDRKEKEDAFDAYIPVTIVTDKVLEKYTLSDAAEEKIKNWMIYGSEVSQHEVLSFSYSAGNYSAVQGFFIRFNNVKKTDAGYEGQIRIANEYIYSQDFFDKYESGVREAVKEMDVAGKLDYDKAYGVCDWVHKNVKYAPSGHDQSGIYAMTEKTAVCAGLARLTCYIGRCVGIDTFYVYGNTDDDHAWNVVKVDGEWYYIDSTSGPCPYLFLQGNDFADVDSRALALDKEGPQKEKISDISYWNKHSKCAGEHDWKKDVNYHHDKENTCTLPFARRYYCYECGAYKYEYVSAPVGHDYVKDKVIQEADCTHPEITQYSCSKYDKDPSKNKCDGTYSHKKTEQTAPALGHAYTSSVTKEPTCTENGVRTHTCSRCGDSYTETISKTGHKHTEIRGDKEASCTVDGYTGDTYCTDCGTKIKIGKTIPKTGHTWTKGDVVKEATCSEEGQQGYICTRCHAEKKEPIAKKAHTWEVSRVTKEADGTDNIVSYIKKCKVCGEEQEDTMTTITDLSMYWQVGTASYYSSKMDKEQKEGISIRYLPYFNPTDAEDKSLSVTSSDPDIAQIDETAKTITLKKTGDVVITVTAKYNPTVTKSYDITVTHDWEITDKGKKCKVCGAIEEHKWNDGVVTKEPTCTKEGEKTYVCMDKDCYATKVEKVAPLGHNWKYHKLTSTSSNCKCSRCGEEQEHDLEILSVDAPTCTTNGKLHVRCKSCKTRITRKDPDHLALGHDWKDNGNGTAICSREGCGQTHSHTWDQGTITKEPSCAGEGEKIYHCTYDNCKAIKTESIAKTEHTWGEGKITKEAACEEEGVMTYTCTVCREKKTEKIPATGHQHTEVRNKAEATCTKEGYTGDTYCTDCGEKLSSGESIARTAHVWDKGTVTEKADCKKEGTMTYTCTVCQATKMEPIPKTEHVYGEKETKEATCTEDGYILSVCAACGEEKKEILPKTGHQHTEVRNKAEATCIREGYTGDTYCKDCGTELSAGQVIQKKAHEWTKTATVQPTYTAEGYILYTCNTCQETKKESIRQLSYPVAGTRYTVSGSQYKVTKAGAEVMLVATNKKAKSITIPATVTMDGIRYKVTAIGAKAFNGNKKLTKVTIGTNIKKISNNAFYKCKSLKMVTIKSVLLTKKTASKKAFKGVNKKMVIKVPKKVKKVYVKIFKGCKVKEEVSKG